MLAFGATGYKGIRTDVLDPRLEYEKEKSRRRRWHEFVAWAVIVLLHIYALWFSANQTVQLLGKVVVLAEALSALPVCAYFGMRRASRGDPSGTLMVIVVMLATLPNRLVVGPLLVWATGHGSLAHEIMDHSLIPWLVGALPGVLLCLGYLGKTSLLNHYRSRAIWEHLRAGVAATDRQLAEAKLQTLQAQIEPHFLYNTLANIQHLIGHRPADAEAMLTGLIRYLRESLPRMRDVCSTLGQEFALSTAYLDIARIRLGGRLAVETDLPADLQSCAFPPLVIQTLVENALKHGVEPKVGAATIRISASTGQNEICVTVADDGVGLGEVQGTGVGLRNTRERLAAIFGPKARLVLAPNLPTGFIAKVCIPKESA